MSPATKPNPRDSTMAQCAATIRGGERCKNSAIDSSGLCAVHHPDPDRRPATGKPFEESVGSVLRLLGYVVDRDVTVAGCQIDLMAMLRTGVITHRLMVEGKDYDDPVGVEEMKAFVGIVGTARNRAAIDKGLIVGRNGFTRHAKELAETSGIEAVSYDALQNQLIDFRPYLQRLLDDYAASSVARWFIDLSYSESEDYALGDTSVLNRPLEDAVNRLLIKEDKSRLALLGNFGTGKSTWCRKYAHDLAKAYLAGGAGRVPVVVTLSDYDANLDIQQLVLNTLQFTYGMRIDAAICLELQRLGRFLFLLDGFDEMAKRVDADVVRENLRELEKLARIPENKFVVTCRTHFFRDRLHAGVLKDFSVLYIPEWGEAELREYLKKRFADTWERQIDRIHGTHNLAELAQTPLFLEMITETLPKLGEEVRRGELYEKYTSSWIDEQSQRRGARLDAAARMAFVIDLAVRLFRESKLSCHYSEFPKILKARFEVQDAAQMDYLQHDVQSCTFVTRTPAGHYEFRHKSFMEFFVARAMAEQIRGANHDLLSLRIMPVEIRQFLAELLQSAPPKDVLLEWAEKSPEGLLRDNAIALTIDLRLRPAPKPTAARTEEELLLAYLQGDTDAFGAVYAKYAPWLAANLDRRRVPHEIAQEVIADAFIQTLTNRQRLSSISHFRNFILRIALYRATGQLKRRRGVDDNEWAELDEVANVPDARAEPAPFDELPLEAERERKVAAALVKLNPSERMLIERTVLHGDMLSNVARDMNTTYANARVLKSRALQKLRKLLSAEE